MSSRKEIRRLADAVEAANKGPARSRDTSRQPEKLAPMAGGWWFKLNTKLRVNENSSMRATAARRTYPIHAYVGPNGGGKSLAMVKDTIPSLDRGRRVLSTVALLDHKTGLPHPMYDRFEEWDQLLNAENCDVLMDEMVGIAGSRESAKLPVQVQNILVQLRRRNVVLRWTAPAWGRADKIIREVTQSVTECRGYFPDTTIPPRADGEESAIRLWAPKRLFNFRTYDCIDFEDWTNGKRDKAVPLAKEWFLGPGSRVFQSYDTLDAVTRVGAVTDAGTCSVCDGIRSPKRCSCDRPAASARSRVGTGHQRVESFDASHAH